MSETLACQVSHLHFIICTLRPEGGVSKTVEIRVASREPSQVGELPADAESFRFVDRIEGIADVGGVMRRISSADFDLSGVYYPDATRHTREEQIAANPMWQEEFLKQADTPRVRTRTGNWYILMPHDRIVSISREDAAMYSTAGA